MAARSEDLYLRPTARVYAFPPVRAHRAAIRRRRLALGATAVIVVIAGLFATGPSGSVTAGPSSDRSRVVVRSGQTVWDIASRHAPSDMDPRAYLDAILAHNGVTVGEIQPGTKLRLP